MRYLKASLLERCRSLDDDLAEAASDEWDRAVAKYNAALAAIRHQLPVGVRAVLDHFSLHDARVLSIVSARGRLSLVIRLESAAKRAGRMLELIYTLAKPGWGVVPRGDAQEWPKDRGRIQYDEFGKAAGGPGAVFSHSLMLAGGYELRIRFTDLHVRRLTRVVILPTVEQAGLGAP